jgi:hypothetical protein
VYGAEEYEEEEYNEDDYYEDDYYDEGADEDYSNGEGDDYDIEEDDSEPEDPIVAHGPLLPVEDPILTDDNSESTECDVCVSFVKKMARQFGRSIDSKLHIYRACDDTSEQMTQTCARNMTAIFNFLRTKQVTYRQFCEKLNACSDKNKALISKIQNLAARLHAKLAKLASRKVPAMELQDPVTPPTTDAMELRPSRPKNESSETNKTDSMELRPSRPKTDSMELRPSRPKTDSMDLKPSKTNKACKGQAPTRFHVCENGEWVLHYSLSDARLLSLSATGICLALTLFTCLLCTLRRRRSLKAASDESKQPLKTIETI